MKKKLLILLTSGLLLSVSCNSGNTDESRSTDTETQTSDNLTGQSGVQDDMSAKNIVQTAVGSKDHTTLVTALKTAELVDALSNAGPFTVFAPTNAAFDKLPEGTVENLLKAESKETLQDILEYHVYVGVINADAFQEGQSLGQVNGGNVVITKKDGKIMVNNSATIIASIPTSNGVIHVVDGVLLPPKS